MNLEILPLNANTAKTIAKQVVKNMDLRITDKFTPVESKIKFQIGDKKRVTMELTEDKFVQTEEKLKQGRWKFDNQSVVKGCMEELENLFIHNIEYYLNLSKLYKKYRNIKGF